MRRRLHLFWIVTMCGAGILAARPARAQAVPTTPSSSAASASVSAAQPQNRTSRDNLVAERQRLRADLARVQGEIDQLKKGDRGLRADYQLRARLADAEAIARRLTEIDERLRVLSPGGAANAPGAPIGDEPVASPTDGPQELDAKADILTDQAHRVQAQASALKVRIDQVRGRRELRKRAHQLESDPFAPLEGSKRRLLSSPTGVPSPTHSPKTVIVSDSAGSPPTGGPTVGIAPPSTPGGGAATSVTSSTPQTPSTSEPVSDSKSAGAAATTTTPLQIRDQLDPTTLSAGRKPGTGAAAPGDLDAMEKELGALNARAQHLETQAQALRARAHPR